MFPSGKSAQILEPSGIRTVQVHERYIFSNGTAVECNDADECTERTIPIFGSELEDGFKPYENYRGKFEN